jgi:hypothetical protein
MSASLTSPAGPGKIARILVITHDKTRLIGRKK